MKPIKYLQFMPVLARVKEKQDPRMHKIPQNDKDNKTLQDKNQKKEKLAKALRNNLQRRKQSASNITKKS